VLFKFSMLAQTSKVNVRDRGSLPLLLSRVDQLIK
jgi:hypothetical protein